jgi:hypothetical protein
MVILIGGADIMPLKTYSNTYLFSKNAKYERDMYSFIMTYERINTESEEFEDILYDFKRRNIGSSLFKIITSNNIVLGISKNKPLPKLFKVFAAKDVKGDKSYKVFIDASDFITFKDGRWVCLKLDWLVSYIINAMVCYIYTLVGDKILLNNSSIISDGGIAFTRCFTYIIDRMYKISTVQQLRTRVTYLAALYYQVNILCKDYEKNYDSIKANAIKISNIDIKDTQMVDLMVEEKDFENLESLVQAMCRIFSFKDLKTVNIVDLWMKSFGPGTVFALEYFPAFSAMLTDTYVGGYLNQQITIEKICSTSLVSFSKTILQIGASV